MVSADQVADTHRTAAGLWYQLFSHCCFRKHPLLKLFLPWQQYGYLGVVWWAR